MSITRIQQNKYRVKLLEIIKLILNLEMDFEYSTAPSHVYTPPLNIDQTPFFGKLKKPGLKLIGGYNFDG